MASSGELLNTISRFPTQPVPMSDIADSTDMSAKAFREALNKLAASGFIKITGEPLSEVIELTEKGRDAATLLS